MDCSCIAAAWILFWQILSKYLYCDFLTITALPPCARPDGSLAVIISYPLMLKYDLEEKCVSEISSMSILWVLIKRLISLSPLAFDTEHYYKLKLKISTACEICEIHPFMNEKSPSHTILYNWKLIRKAELCNTRILIL